MWQYSVVHMMGVVFVAIGKQVIELFSSPSFSFFMEFIFVKKRKHSCHG